MRNTGLDEAQTGIKTAGRKINNLRYADDTTLMAEIEGELKNYIYYCGQESLRRNGGAIMVNRRVLNAALGCNLNNGHLLIISITFIDENPLEDNKNYFGANC